jgi:hypothetical protein
MRRATLVCLALLALSVPATATGAAPAARRGGPQVYMHFSLKADNGLTAQVFASGNTVDLQIGGHGQFVGYRVKGAVSAGRVSARFGSLGRISVRFQPRGRATGSVHKGVFLGTIEFTGERDYVHIDATRAVGSVLDTTRTFHGHLVSSSRAEVERVVGTLEATAGGRSFRAAGYLEPDGSGRAYFAASVRERQGAMQVTRVALAKAPVSAFAFDHAAGTATVQPPAPFSGSAAILTRPDASKGFEGTLSVALLGVDPVLFAGPEFKAKLSDQFDD